MTERSPFRNWTVKHWTRMWLVFWCLMFLATHMPMKSKGMPYLKHADKVVHFVMFFTLTWIGGRRLRASTGIVAGGALFAWAVVYAAYAFVDEWLQPLVGRSMTLWDWIADASGIVAASILLYLTRSRATLSEPPAPDA